MHPIFKIMAPRKYDPKFWIRFDQSQEAIRRGSINYINYIEMRDCKYWHERRLRMVLFEMEMTFDWDY